MVTPDDAADGFAPGALDDLRSEALTLPHVLGANEPVTSPDGRVALVSIQYPTLEELSAADLTALQELRDRADADAPLQVELRGDLVFAFAEPETGGEVVGIVAALVILLVAFGSFVAAGIPIGVAVTGLATAVGALTLVANLVDVPTWAPVLGAMVGLGVGIDYALFILTRHREHLAAGVPVQESIARAVATAGASVVLAGGIVVVAILGLSVAQVPFMTAGAIAVSVIVLVMVLASITLLPALLAHRGAAGQRRPRPRPPCPLGRPVAAPGRARGGPPAAVRRRGRRPCSSCSPRRARAARRHPRRRHAARDPHRAAGLRPARRRVRSRRQRPAAGGRRPGRRPGRRGAAPGRARRRPRHRVGRPGDPGRVRRAGDDARPPDDRAAGRGHPRDDRAAAHRGDPGRAGDSPATPTSAARPPGSPTSAPASTSGCRGSSRPSSCSRRCSSPWSSAPW